MRHCRDKKQKVGKKAKGRWRTGHHPMTVRIRVRQLRLDKQIADHSKSLSE